MSGAAERDALIEEHGNLVQRMFAGEMSAAESDRLESVRRRIDQIDMAEAAPHLARLEAAVRAREAEVAALEDLVRRTRAIARRRA